MRSSACWTNCSPRVQASSGDPAHFAYEEQLKTPLRDKMLELEKGGVTSVVELGEVRGRIEALVIDWPANNPEAAAGQLDKIAGELKQARQRHGFLQASGTFTHVPLSDQSGPAANEPPEQLRYGPDGRPLVPYDNSAYLGRSLFTDFLLPVELGGVLLLVATAGAIAIAHRVQPERRP